MRAMAAELAVVVHGAVVAVKEAAMGTVVVVATAMVVTVGLPAAVAPVAPLLVGLDMGCNVHFGCIQSNQIGKR